MNQMLANFEEPEKVNWVSYMERYFMFNLPLQKFGYLTGRSLTTFKRDFSNAQHHAPAVALSKAIGIGTLPIY